MVPIVGLAHGDDRPALQRQVLAQQDLAVRDADEVEIAAQLAAENGIVVDLEHAEDVLAQLDLEGDEVVDWVEAEEVAVGAADEDVLLDVLGQEVAD